MGKTYVDTVKYLIKASFEVDGIIEKPDIVGAIFGQTEGLLGDELDLRELQKNGRIGRIEVDLQLRGGKSFGTVIVPSSLDMVETSILGGALEIVDRVGPCEARIKVHRIEDSRNLKRKQVLDRAKGLLKSLVTEELPESKELADMVRDELKLSDVVSYGADKLAAGPEVARSDSIILVEGRADVNNLLKNNIKNVVAIGGAKVSNTVVALCEQKEVIAFLDGDRGGDIILRELIAAADIDFVARAPTGHEVEELSRKEIIRCLRRKVPVEQVEGYSSMMDTRRESRKNASLPKLKPFDQQQDAPEPMQEQQAPAPVERSVPVAAAPVAQPAARKSAIDPETEAKLRSTLKELEGSLKARLLNPSFGIAAEVPIREIMKTVTDSSEVSAVVLDGIVTQRLLDLAESKGIKNVAGIRAGNLTRKPLGVAIVLAE
ncbi:DNA primase [Candidatus Micrarchaeota archaeon]|nr:DNA primase [Candidatus Micrarchaeota archaeon]